MDEAALAAALQNIDQLDEYALVELSKLVEELETRTVRENCRDSLLAFCQYMQDDYKIGAHHRRLAKLLEEIERGEKDRICVSVPPRHGKSQLVSIYYAAWYLGKNPSHKVMLVSHTGDLAVDFGRKVRNLIATEKYQEIFPGVTLAADSKSAGRWNTNRGGEFFAAGVGAALAGRGAHLLLIDDPHSEQDVLAGNFAVFERAYQWFAYGARTRLMPGGRVAIVHCMTGDTGVLRPDGTETPLRDIRPGDIIASYKDGGLVSRKVLNWANQGPDNVYALAMDNGNLIRANARHPFLVVRDGVETWVKLRDLQVGDSLVSLMGAQAPHDRNLPRVSVPHACPKTTTTASTLTQNATLLAIRGAGAVLRAASTTAVRLWKLRGYAGSITTALRTPLEKPLACPTVLRSAGVTTYARGTALPTPSTLPCASRNTIAALYAGFTHLLSRAPKVGARIIRSQWTTATTAGQCARFYATPATSSSVATAPQISSVRPLTTSRIMSITPDGVEDVFDIQVEDTENFIADGVVSHNTRWAQDDLIGRVIRDMTQNEDADQYEVFEFPAILESVDPETNEVTEKALWPEFFDLPALKRTKATMPVFQWNAQYQQNPTGEEAAVVKREWWNIWTKDDPPACEYIIMALDAAAEAHNRADFTSLTTWGVFLNEETGAHNIILLDAIKERMEFPELKRLATQEYKKWEPDAFIVEKKSSGTPLYQEMRRSGLIVQEYTPTRGAANNPNTKMARLNSVADIVQSGLCWVPARRWGEELVEEIAGFPFMANDDQVDTTIMALMRFRQGGFITLPHDDWGEEQDYTYREPVEYY